MQRLGSSVSGLQGDDLANVDMDMTPLIDMIFILLIFFLVTASFVRESGVEVNRPEAASAEKKESVGLIVGINAAGKAFIDSQQVAPSRIRGIIEVFLLENPKGGVIINADKDCPTGNMIEVLDQCRLAGAKNIAVSAVKKGN